MAWLKLCSFNATPIYRGLRLRTDLNQMFLVRGLVCGEELPDLFGGGFVDDGCQRVGIFFGGLFQGADAAEVFEEALAGDGAYAGDFVEFAGAVAHLAALAVVGDGEAVGFVADLLDDVQDGRAAVEDYRVVLLAVDVDDLFALGDGGEGLGGEADLVEGVSGGVELA
jgi:hypothetical protein